MVKETDHCGNSKHKQDTITYDGNGMKAFELLRKEMEATGEETKEQTDIVLKENKKALQEWNTYLQEETITVTTTISRYVSNKCRYVVV